MQPWKKADCTKKYSTKRKRCPYRIDLVLILDFSDVPDDFWGWEHTTRNRGDVIRMKQMLRRVRTPDGGRYAVKVQHNTSHDQLVRLITDTFAGADENDVSLFFIATHGDSSDDAPDEMAGALVMASASETYPEDFPLSELRDLLLQVPGKVIVILQSCGSGAAIFSNDSSSSKVRRAAEAFDSNAIRLFQEADPGIHEPVANTGEFRVANKFYVLCASGYREETWGDEPDTDKGYGSNPATFALRCSGLSPPINQYLHTTKQYASPKIRDLPVLVDQEVFHGYPQHPGQRQQVVDAGQALPMLPLVNGLRVFKPEVGLKLPHGHARLLAEPPDVAARARQVDDRENGAFTHATFSPL